MLLLIALQFVLISPELRWLHSGVAVPSWLTSLSFTGARARTWPGLVVWPGLLAVSLSGLSRFLTKQVATSILVLTFPRVCLLLSFQFLI